ncbi:hypothetical protein IEQ34_003578 [Dendrobium chrysotoxum]|uniref:Uncharacterized protein n=1 Tax=Dendrobium chrysotoxum TaxID=161865 RepID=A0AAV7HML9_DENCH|nr:hypothetical protein IEQ34_003578 [Dendrobium chrysotoxum]
MKLTSIIPMTLRYLSVQTTELEILRRIQEFKHSHSLLSSSKLFNQELCSALVSIAFKILRMFRRLVMPDYTPKGGLDIVEMISDRKMDFGVVFGMSSIL